MAATKVITLWLDKTSDSDRPQWIVGKGRLVDGELIEDSTLSVWETEREAFDEAANEAICRGCDVVETDSNGCVSVAYSCER